MNDQLEMTREEDDNLIGAQKVKGTAVYDSEGEKIGSIDDVMLTKRSGKVAYAVMSFGGFLGIGERYHPLPWEALDYDVEIGGYRVGMAGEGFRDAPSYAQDDLSRDGWGSTDVDDFYDRARKQGSLKHGPGRHLPDAPGTGAGANAGVAGVNRQGHATGPMGTQGGPGRV
jgi:hypothetical protein